MQRRGPVPSRPIGAISVCCAILCVSCQPLPDAAQPAPDREINRFAAGACARYSQGLAAAASRADGFLLDWRRSNAIPGMSAGAVCIDTLVWAKGYGVLSLDNQQSVTPNALFRIASVTKVFTAAAILKLAGEGRLNLDAPVNEYIDWFDIGRTPESGDSELTVRQLLSHTSGLPRDSALTDFSRNFQPASADAIAALPGQALQSAPGERYAYSNLGYAVLGQVISSVSGRTYAEYLETEILEPLGMISTLVHPSPQDLTAWGHGPKRLVFGRRLADFWDLRFATPAGGMASSVSDLSKFMKMQIAPYQSLDPAPLTREAVLESHAVQFVVEPGIAGVGLSWGIDMSDGQYVIYHGGDLPDQTAFMIIDIRSGLGIVLLTNAQDVDVEGAARQLLGEFQAALAD